MARPRAIYASIPDGSSEEPLWLGEPGLLKPVLFEKPFNNWPDLNWLGDLVGDNSPTDYGYEIPEYLWSNSEVQYPETGETQTFTRQWYVWEPAFTSTNIPMGDYICVISHAADDQYELQLAVKGIPLNPWGGNSFIPAPSTWRNTKTYVYRLIVASDDDVTLTSIVTNDPQPGGTSNSNPAMFTWLMQVFEHPLPF